MIESKAPTPAKADNIRGVFAEISATYDMMNSAMSFGLHQRWRRFAVRLIDLQSSDRVLDLCCGTGDFATAINVVAGTRQIMGIDFCSPMLSVAVRKQVPGGFALGDGCQLPVRSECVDAVTIGWGLRNVSDYQAVIEEIYRVLKPGGRFVSLDMAVPRSPLAKAVSKIALQKLVPAMGAVLGKRQAYAYLPKSTQAFLSRDEQVAQMQAAGFSKLSVHDLFFGNICAHRGVK